MRGGPVRSSGKGESKGRGGVGRWYVPVWGLGVKSCERMVEMQALSGRSIFDGKLAVHSSSEERIPSFDSEKLFSTGRGHAGLSGLLVGCPFMFRGAICLDDGDEFKLNGGLVIARSNRRWGGIGWNFLLNDDSRDGALLLSPSAGVIGGLRDKDIQLFLVLFHGAVKGQGVLSKDEVLGGILIERPDAGLMLTSTILALAGARIVAQANSSSS